MPSLKQPCGGYIHRVFLTRGWLKIERIDKSAADTFVRIWADFWYTHYKVIKILGR